jgi:hypothetical protein
VRAQDGAVAEERRQIGLGGFYVREATAQPPDDPQGEVAIEFMVVTDGSGHHATTDQVPLTSRAQALTATNRGSIGTAEHGVLGRRWIYAETCDPVLVVQLVALIQDDAQPQAQSVSNNPIPR